jgi:hypothetical protein
MVVVLVDLTNERSGRLDIYTEWREVDVLENNFALVREDEQ